MTKSAWVLMFFKIAQSLPLINFIFGHHWIVYFDLNFNLIQKKFFSSLFLSTINQISRRFLLLSYLKFDNHCTLMHYLHNKMIMLSFAISFRHHFFLKIYRWILNIAIGFLSNFPAFFSCLFF